MIIVILIRLLHNNLQKNKKIILDHFQNLYVKQIKNLITTNRTGKHIANTLPHIYICVVLLIF